MWNITKQNSAAERNEYEQELSNLFHINKNKIISFRNDESAESNRQQQKERWGAERINDSIAAERRESRTRRKRGEKKKRQELEFTRPKWADENRNQTKINRIQDINR